METDVEKRIKKVADQLNEMTEALRLIAFDCDNNENVIIDYNTILGELWNDDIISTGFYYKNKIDFDYGR